MSQDAPNADDNCSIDLHTFFTRGPSAASSDMRLGSLDRRRAPA